MREPGDLFGVRGRVACVTGASAGLGRRAALVLAAAGARVVGVARRGGALAAWRAEAGGQTAAVVHDLSERGALGALAEAVVAPFGPPQIVVHAAGINTPEPAGAVTQAGWDLTLDLNLRAPFFLSQSLVAGMRARGRGRFVTFASLQSFRAVPGGVAYGASKGGVAQLTRAMAAAWSAEGITANAIGPGFFPTELTKAVFADEARAARNAAQTCAARNGRPEDLDGPLLFLCSDAAAYVTGQVLMVDGGFTAR